MSGTIATTFPARGVQSDLDAFPAPKGEVVTNGM